MSSIASLLSVELFLAAAAYAGSDPILSVPNYNGPPLCFKHYSGYLPAAQATKNLFHWYVEATFEPTKKPIVFWLNGHTSEFTAAPPRTM